MIHNQCKVDDIDKVILITALSACNEMEDRLPEGEVFRVDVGEIGLFYPAAMKALEFVAQMHRQAPDDFDGAAWLDRLESTARGSLADMLVEILLEYPCSEEVIREVVIVWLKESGL
ncbi:hypothetical protein HOV23_gp071 [Pseudomonas phage Lana]|uniref:Uncharacterized protein n=1 Tax=Pseudomonas phage Lana TaxID=2530172 RepID=A0A481W7W7_9CAUD|nr:hypothetical protein HOV23_gp071 [Pseudomonas phage Lana]QBJ04502.1 hypothetical protein [Pseudomonas phage Lana]